jgi:ribosomal protein S9
MATESRYNINVTTTGADAAAAQLGRVDRAVESIGRAAAGAAAGYFGASGLIQGLRWAIRESATAELAQTRLAVSFGRSTAGLEAFAKARMRATTIEDDATISAMALLATRVKDEAQIKRLIVGVQDLSVKLGMDLDSAAQMVTKATAGNTVALSRYGIEIDKTLPLIDGIVDALKRYAEGQAEAEAATNAGRLKQIENAWNDVGEAIGDVATPALVAFGNALTGVLRAAEMDTEKIEDMLHLRIGSVARRAAATMKAEVRRAGPIQLPGLEVVGDKAAFDAAAKAAEEALRARIDLETREFNMVAAWEDRARALGEALVEVQETQADIDVSADPDGGGFAAWMEAGQRAIEKRKAATKAALHEEALARTQMVGSALGSFAQLNAAMKGNMTLTRRLLQAQAIMDTYAGADRALGAYPPPWSFIAAAAVIAQGLANVAAIQAQGFASGGWVSGPGGSRSDAVPARLSAGERVLSVREIALMGGRGAVDALARGGMGGGITVHFSGPVTDRAYVQDFIIPEIKRAVRLSA